MTLQGRHALVTGGSRGIGRAIALALAAEGAKVTVNYHHCAEAAREVAGQVRAAGQEAVALQADVRKPEEVRQMVDQATAALGPLGILVNNAGLIRDNLVTFMKDEEWDEVLDTNLKGAFTCIKLAGKGMVRRRSGRIINIASDAGLLGDVMRANYASAKAGLIGLTKTVAREFAGYGVNVNAVAPGIVETDLIAGLKGAKRARRMDQIPMGRFGTPEEVARVVVFLAGEDSSYITGQILCVDGGLRM